VHVSDASAKQKKALMGTEYELRLDCSVHVFTVASLQWV